MSVCNWMVVQARHKSANLNMLIISHLDLISDLAALEAHSFSWQLGLKEVVSCQCARGQVLYAAPGWDADHVSLSLAGWQLRSGPLLTHLTWLFLSHFICLFSFCLYLHAAIYFLCVSLSLIFTYSNLTTSTEKIKGHQGGNLPT